MSWNFPLLFFLLLIPLSGFIAWAGDRIGHRIGKRRHTLLGLRPRHTATVTTVGAGMVICLVSFGLMWASNATFRAVLRDGAALYENNRRLKRENAALQENAHTQRALVTRVRDEARQAGAERDRARAAQEEAQTHLAGARATLVQATAELSAARGSLTATRAQIADKEAKVVAAREAVREAEGRLARTRHEADRAQRTAARAETRVAGAERTLNALTRLIRERNAFQQAESRRQQNELVRLAAQKDELLKLTEELEAKRARYGLELGQTLDQTTTLRRRPITYQVGEEVDRASVSSELSAPDLQRELNRLLVRAAERAARRGATAADQQGRAVMILPKQVPMGGPASGSNAAGDGGGGGDGAGARIVDEADSVAAAAEAIRQAAGADVAVLVVASANAVEGEPVPVEFRTYRNRRVFREGATLGEITLDGTRPQPALADALYTFLRRDVRQNLIEGGIIPPARAAAARMSVPGGGGAGAAEGDGDEDGGGGSLVSISGERWFRMLDEVRRAGPAARVVVRAARDLRAADPVALNFEVTPVRDTAAAATARAGTAGAP